MRYINLRLTYLLTEATWSTLLTFNEVDRVEFKFVARLYQA